MPEHFSLHERQIWNVDLFKKILRTNGSIKSKTFMCLSTVNWITKEGEWETVWLDKGHTTLPPIEISCKLRLYGAHWLGSHSGSETTFFCNGPFGSKFLIDELPMQKSLAKVYTIVSVSGWVACRTGWHYAFMTNTFRNLDKYICQIRWSAERGCVLYNICGSDTSSFDVPTNWRPAWAQPASTGPSDSIAIQ